MLSHVSEFCSSTGDHLGCFHLLSILNTAAMNTGVKIPVPVPAFSSFGASRSEIAESYRSPTFNVLRHCQIVSTVAAAFSIPTSNVQGF